MMSRQQRRHSSGMSYADKLAREKMLREAAQIAANNTAAQIKADIQVQKVSWLTMLALNDEFQFGQSRYERLAKALTDRAEWYDGMVKGADEDYANEKMRQEVERVTHQEVDFAWEEELIAARKRHENDKITRYEQFLLYKPQKMAETICKWLECQNCPGRELCSHKEGKANGLVKWFEQEVDR